MVKYFVMKIPYIIVNHLTDRFFSPLSNGIAGLRNRPLLGHFCNKLKFICNHFFRSDLPVPTVLHSGEVVMRNTE